MIRKVVGGLFTFVAVVIGAFCLLAFMGILIEGYGEHREDIERCQKHASTPYEYNRC